MVVEEVVVMVKEVTMAMAMAMEKWWRRDRDGEMAMVRWRW